MAKVKPFKALLYNNMKIDGDYSAVMAPPYDVISVCMQDELYAKSEYNIIKLILGKSLDSDDLENNKYTRAKEFLDQWQNQGVFVKDADEVLYVYLQEYNHKGRKCCRIGFIGIMKIEDPAENIVLPHEYTLVKPKEDRMRLIKEVQSNLSPIFTLYDDTDGKVKAILEETTCSTDPVIDIELNDEQHKLWRLRDKESIKKITSQMKGKKIFIADGHHRYEVARNYRDVQKEKSGYNGNADHVMVYFTDLTDTNNLTVMPTHRVIKKIPTSDEDEIITRLSKYFHVTEHSNLSELMKQLEEDSCEQHVFGFFSGRNFFLIKPKDKNELLGLIREDKPMQWKELDVSVLHSVVFDSILSVSKLEGNITYVKDPEEAEALVKDGSHMAAFFLNPTRLEQLKAVARLGEMMPQKSTYFYPKLLTGLVIHQFESGDQEGS